MSHSQSVEESGESDGDVGERYKGVPVGPVRNEALLLSGLYESEDGAEGIGIPERQSEIASKMLDDLFEFRSKAPVSDNTILDGDLAAERIVTDAFEQILATSSGEDEG